jgi:capsular exopolysaccharide synthesis family protein
MSIGQYLGLLRSHRWLVAVSILVCTAAAGVLSSIVTPTYEARAQFFVSSGSLAGKGGGLYEAGLFEQQRARSYAEIIMSSREAQRVIEQFGLEESVQDVRERIRAYIPPNSLVIYLAVRSHSPWQAESIADSISARLPELAGSLEMPGAVRRSPIQVTVTEPARRPIEPVAPRTPAYLALGVLFGLAFGVAGARLRHALDLRIRSDADVDELGVPVLGRIPSSADEGGSPVLVGGPLSAAAEGYRGLRANLGALRAEHRLRCILVSSPGYGEGKTALVANLGVAFAQAGRHVVLVDANLRSPGLGELLGISPGPGLSDVLEGERPIESALRPYPAGPLAVLTSGRPSRKPSELLDSGALDRALDGLMDQFEVIILDSPALLAVTDAAILARRASGVILTARTAVTGSDELRAARQTLSAVRASMLGVVLVGAADHEDRHHATGRVPPLRARPTTAFGADGPGSP